MKSRDKKILLTILLIGGPAALVFEHSALHAMIASFLGFVGFIVLALAWFAAVVFTAQRYDDATNSQRQRTTTPSACAAKAHSPTCGRRFTIFAVNPAGVATMASLRHLCQPTLEASHGSTAERA